MGIVIVGASGHGKVVCDALLACNETVQGFADDDAIKWGGSLLNLPILGNIESLHKDTRLIMGIGDNRTRAKVYHRATALAFRFVSVIHPSAVIGRGCQLGESVAVLANVTLNVDAHIGQNVILNTACSIDHDCVIEAHAHIAPGARLAGYVKVGEETLIGVGASVIPGIKVGAHCVVGAGSVVIQDIADHCVVAGNPARVIKVLGA